MADMDKLSDFKPLQRVVLPGLGELDCSGLVVLVGPNSSGKSQFLQDIYRRLVGEPRQLVVASDIQINKPPLEPFLQWLEEEGYFATVEDDSGTKQIRPLTMYLGTGQPVGQIHAHQAHQWYSTYAPEAPQFPRRASEFLNYFGRLLVTALFLDRRLTSLTATGVIDFLSQPPSHDLHALYLNDRARELLYEEMIRSFGRAVWPDMSRGSLMSLKVSDEGVLPSPEDRLSSSKMAAFRSVEDEGDGMKSYLATCVSLLLGRRPVCLIDEPELCLHPPQAYNLGRFIGRFGAGQESATLVATHSSHLLRGILQTATDVQIVRLTRREKRFSAYLVPATELTDALTRPTLRAEAILDGIFAQAVVVVEADGDRLVYQAAWETLSDKFRLDIHFSTAGGAGGIADTCRLYRTLKIPVAVIADLDVLTDSDRMDRIVRALVDDEEEQRLLIEASCSVALALKSAPPAISSQDVIRELSDIAAASMDWDSNDDIKIRKRIRQLSNSIDRMARLKRGGVGAYPGELSDRIIGVLRQLAEKGLFLVPVGELEEWLSDYRVGVSKNDKRAWSNAAAQLIHKTGLQEGDVWEFVTSVASYVTAVGEPVAVATADIAGA